MAHRNDSELLTYREMSERYGFKTQTLATWVHRGRIPHVRLGTRCVRFRRRDVEAWLQSCARPVQSAAGGE